jgi:hypothetical protein
VCYSVIVLFLIVRRGRTIKLKAKKIHRRDRGERREKIKTKRELATDSHGPTQTDKLKAESSKEKTFTAEIAESAEVRLKLKEN